MTHLMHSQVRLCWSDEAGGRSARLGDEEAEI